MTLFSIITGLAGIISLLIPFIPTLAEWKRYFYYFSFTCIGITLGLIAAMSEKALNTFDSYQIVQVILILSILAIATFISYLIIKRGNHLLGYAVIILVIGLYLPTNLDKLKSKNAHSQEEILILANHYQLNKNFKRASNLLRQYKELMNEDEKKRHSQLLDLKIRSLDSLALTQ